MGDVPTINTTSWRLPKKAHSRPEASFTDKMYLQKGLPVPPDPTPTTEGGGAPVVDTGDWRLPSSKARELAEAEGELAEGQNIRSLLKRGYWVEFEVGRSLFRATHWPSGAVSYAEHVMGRWGVDHKFDTVAKFLQILMGKDLKIKKHGKIDPSSAAMYDPHRGKAEGVLSPGQVITDDEGGEYEILGKLFDARPAEEAKACPKSFLKRKKRKGQDVGPPRAADDDAANEGRALYRHNAPERPALQRAHLDIPRLRRLAGLTESEHIEFATGAPHRQMPSETRVRAELSEAGFSKTDIGVLKRMAPTGRIEVTALSTRERKAAEKLAKAHMLKLMGKEYRFLRSAATNPYVRKTNPNAPYEVESKLPAEQQMLAGLTESSPHPLPMGDTRGLQTPRAHGILDDGADDGDTFVDQVLAESRWFFRDFGDLSLGASRPFGEAPGGRAGPWRGSDDEPAPTPVVRKGKVKGVVGQKGAQDDAEDDDEPEDDQDAQKPPRRKQAPPKGKAAAGDDEDEEEEDDEDREDEQDEWIEEGKRLRKLAGHLKAAGHRFSHGRAAQRAKAGLHHHLQKFAKKHGIDVHKHLHPHDRPKPKKGEIGKATVHKGPPPKLKKGKGGGSTHKGKKVLSHGSGRSQAARKKQDPKKFGKKKGGFKPSRHHIAMARKKGKPAPKKALKKMKRRMREIIDVGLPNILL
jgi:hypothetical protein